MVPRLRSAGVFAGGMAVTVLSYVLLVEVLGQDYNAKNLTLVGAFALATLGLALLLGTMHQFNLGQAFFLGFGAYTYAVLAADHQWSPLAAAGAALVASAVLAYVIGRILLRLEGFYFSVATLGMGLIGENVLYVLRDVTGGDDGRSAPKLEVFGFAFDTPLRQHLLVGTCLAVGFTVAWNLVRSRVGRAARAVGLDEMMAASNGVDVARAKTQMFVVSAVYATLGGCLYAAVSGYIFPTVAGISMTLEFVVAVILGGMGSVVGPVLAIAFLRWLPILFESIEEHVSLVYGASLIILLVMLPASHERRRILPFPRAQAPKPAVGASEEAA